MHKLSNMGRPRNPETIHHLFRGVIISLYPNSRGRWEGSFTIPGQRRKKAFGSTERLCREAAEDRIRDLMDPDVLAALSDEDMARDLLKSLGISLTEAARYYLSQHNQPLLPIAMAEARDRWLTHIKTSGGKKRYNHHRSCAQRSKHLLPLFGERQISSITLVELTLWHDELLITRAGRTCRNIQDAARAMFKFCRKRGYLAFDRLSAAELMERPIVEPGKKGTFTYEEMQKLIDTAWGYAMPGALAMVTVAFASTRSEELSKQDPDAPLENRIMWEDIQWKENHIYVRQEVAKTRRARKAGLPVNLKAMLRPLRGKGPLYTGVRLDLAYAEIAKKAGVVWKANGLRHSCLTYAVLLAHNATEVAIRAGNSVSVIESSYLNTSATRAQALKWATLRPRVPWGSLLKRRVKPLKKPEPA